MRWPDDQLHSPPENGAGPRKIKVLCVDDSALVRGIMAQIINDQPDMEVVAVAPDPLVARELIKQHNPDVLTLDVEMPRMDGLDFLERLMRLRPMPVLMISSLTERAVRRSRCARSSWALSTSSPSPGWVCVMVCSNTVS